MRYAIYEDAVTHRFALIELPAKFVDGDDVPRAAKVWREVPPEQVGEEPPS